MPRGAAADREWVARAFTHVEDAVYLGVGLLLAASAIALLVVSGITFVRSVLEGVLAARVVGLLDYTVQVSFREHALIPEPFLIVGLIAGIRRVLLRRRAPGAAAEKA